MVEIMAARENNPEYEIEDAPHRKNVKFSAFVDMVMSGQETNDYYLTARNNFFSRPGVAPLLQDIDIFSEYLKQSSEGVFMWYGPKGTVTPLHHDTTNIMLAQVQGRKHLKLIPANEIELIYNHYAVYSQVNAEKPDYKKYPNFKYATVIDVELAPGDVLFMPVGWWHWVKALETSITVTFNNFLFPNEFKWEHPASPKPYAAAY
jgi:ribosomal protein L16 Arg81 hydroxylase